MTQTLPLNDTAIEAIYLQDSAAEYSCERGGECDREAVYKVLWMPEAENAEGEPVDSCTCGPHSYLMCVLCYDLLTSRAGLCWCAACSPSGPHNFKTIVARERIKR